MRLDTAQLLSYYLLCSAQVNRMRGINMSEARPKRAPRESTRRTGTAATEASPTAPAEIDTGSVPETATAAVALATAAVEPIPEPVVTLAEPAAEAMPAPPQAPGDTKPAGEDLWADPWSALTEAQSALARGFEAVATEVGGLTRSGIAASTEAATAMLGAKTLAEAIEINTGYARRGFDAMLGGAAKLSEIGVKAATDASRPILDRLGESWKSLNGH
jgi:phasin family protein